MKFKVPEERPEFDWPVKVKVPAEGGRFDTQTFTARFRLVPRDEINAHLERQAAALQRQTRALSGAGRTAFDQGADGEPAPVVESYDAEDAIMRDYWIGWSDMIDGDNQEVPYSDALRDRLLGIQWVRRGVAAAYGQAVSGEAKLKN